MSCPPKFNPTKGASERTLIFIAVQRFLLKYIARQCRHADRFRQVETTSASADSEAADPGAESNSIRPRTTDVTAAEIADVTEPGQSAVERVRRELRGRHSMTDNVLDFIVDETSRDLCRLVVECDGNVSAAARQLGVAEGTIRRARPGLAGAQNDKRHAAARSTRPGGGPDTAAAGAAMDVVNLLTIDQFDFDRLERTESANSAR